PTVASPGVSGTPVVGGTDGAMSTATVVAGTSTAASTASAASAPPASRQEAASSVTAMDEISAAIGSIVKSVLTRTYGRCVPYPRRSSISKSTVLATARTAPALSVHVA